MLSIAAFLSGGGAFHVETNSTKQEPSTNTCYNTKNLEILCKVKQVICKFLTFVGVDLSGSFHSYISNGMRFFRSPCFSELQWDNSQQSICLRYLDLDEIYQKTEEEQYYHLYKSLKKQPSWWTGPALQLIDRWLGWYPLLSVGRGWTTHKEWWGQVSLGAVRQYLHQQPLVFLWRYLENFFLWDKLIKMTTTTTSTTKRFVSTRIVK